MYDFECQDRTTGKIFHKVFNDETSARKFALRCRYGKKILILSVMGCYTIETYDYIMGY